MAIKNQSEEVQLKIFRLYESKMQLPQKHSLGKEYL